MGVDTGGTFTDIVFRNGTESGTLKLLSTPDNPATAVLDGLQRLFDERCADLLTYGTTVATNAMLERRGADTALVVTRGFEDLLEIGRQARPDLYALEPRKPPSLVPRSRCYGLTERSLYDGTRKVRPAREELAELKRKLDRAHIESVAVCLLHAPANGRNEREVERSLAGLGVPISVSHRLSPAPGEYERAATTVANAYVRPVLESHIRTLEGGTGARRFRVMQSNGGGIGADLASREPIRTMLSGPAGGVVAAARCAAAAGIERAITFDMGGTSTDVALIAGDLPRRDTTIVGHVPVRTPCLDIHTVGAGGGSIAELDAGGSLKVGPKSAGADPGPACYGRGRLPTVTDAHVLLGRLRASDFLGGRMPLYPRRAERCIGTLARRMHTDLLTAAAGIIEVVEGNMERAVRLITVERGEDPRDCMLICFGGAAGLHACGLADKLGLRSALVPRDPGLLSARGILEGAVVRDETAHTRIVNPTFAVLAKASRPLLARSKALVRGEGIAANAIHGEAFVKLRYLGESMELEVPLQRSFRRDFDRHHRKLFHQADDKRAVECVGVRVSVTGNTASQTPETVTPTRARVARSAATRGKRHRETARIFRRGRQRLVPVYHRDEMPIGLERKGPAVIVEYSSTVFVDVGWRLAVDGAGNIRLDR